MRIDVVFSGGGVKAYAYLGVLKSLEKRNYEIVRVAGTSAGAILASFIAAGFTTEEIDELMADLDIDLFMDSPFITKVFPFTKWFNLYFKMGLYKGNKLESWIYHKLSEKDIYTFNDIKEGSLKIIVSDLTLGKLIVIPDDLNRVYGIDPKNFSIAKSVRMSAGFPYFFIPKRIEDKSIIVDGGLLSNFPLWIFPSGGMLTRPVLGVKLTEEFREPPKLNNAVQMLQALFHTMKTAHDTRFIAKEERENILYIPTGNVKAMDFKISESEKVKLIDEGKLQADIFLANWPK